MRKTVLELDSKKALKYFMEAENYCTLPLPSYFQFQKMLNYIKNSIRKRTFNGCLKNKKIMPSNMEGVNYKLLITKDGKYSFRPIQITNPYLYYILVREITEVNNWRKIQKRFGEFKSENIEVSSIPVVKEKGDKTTTGAQIHNWWTNLEQRTIELSLQYKYMFLTDITNCYGSIYTHTIDWAIEGKDEAKKNNLQRTSSLGHTIDTYISGMQYGQTNGLPQGSVIYDFIAELLLGYADMLLQKWAEEKGMTNYIILRYRDDYRIFGDSKDDIEEIVMALQKILADLNFQLNSTKTRMTEDIVEMAIKKDKFAYIQNVPIYKVHRVGKAKVQDKIESTFDSYQKELYYMLAFSKQWPGSSSLRQMLQLFNLRIQQEKSKTIKHPEILIAICAEIGYLNPKYCQNVIAIVSYLVTQVDDFEKRKLLIESVRKKLERLPNVGMIQVWLQRITFQVDINDMLCPYEEMLCKMVMDGNVKLWNFDWLKDELYADFPYQEVVNHHELYKLTPVIAQEEIDCFYYDDFPSNQQELSSEE